MQRFWFFILFLGPWLISCDFSSQLHQEIIQAQKSIGQQNYSEAIIRYERILKKNPSKKIRLKIYNQLGELYSIHMGDSAKAISYYKKLAQLTDDPAWMVKVEEKLGELNFTFIKDYEESQKNYFNLVNITPKLAKQDFYEFRLGLSLLMGGKIQKSLETFKVINAKETHEYYVQSFYYLGVGNFYLKEWDLALKFWGDYLNKEKRREKIVETKFLMANVFETTEKLKEAYDLYYSILSEYPYPEVVRIRLKSLYARRIARKR